MVPAVPVCVMIVQKHATPLQECASIVPTTQRERSVRYVHRHTLATLCRAHAKVLLMQGIYIS